ncbi:MAG: ABC-type phosphate/phosphonate transport system substrate-binding protein [Myxococcota bacterium]|jgi:ABC-type phosphate/phosphonate transport system substrate-binding protein
MPLHLVTWLAPSIPLAFYERIRADLSTVLGLEVTLQTDQRSSGPSAGDDNPFSDGRADVGFLCAPTLVALGRELQSNVVTSELAPVFNDPRNEGRPIYFCDVVVRADSTLADLNALRGHTFGFNDPLSLSGWLGLRSHLKALGTSPERHFGQIVRTGSHLSSLDALMSGQIDVASVDSNTRLLLPEQTLQQVRVVTTVGPWPMQPVAFRRDLHPRLRQAVGAALRRMGPWPDFNFRGFAHQPRQDLARVPVPGRVGPRQPTR